MMTSRDFCYWLQGYLELANEADEPKPLTPKQMQAIANHLGLVFKHEIDPSMGPPAHQAVLNKIHKPAPFDLPPRPDEKWDDGPGGIYGIHGGGMLRC